MPRYQGDNMLPASLGVAELHETAEAIKSYLSDGSSGGAGGGGGRHKKKKGKWSWDDPWDAPWRLSESWIYSKPGHRRYIKVNCGARQGWLTFPPGPTEQLLEWYDRGRFGDEITGVMTDLENQHAYNYRIEGGMYLTQRNPNRENKPRECHIFTAPCRLRATARRAPCSSRLRTDLPRAGRPPRACCCGQRSARGAAAFRPAAPAETLCRAAPGVLLDGLEQMRTTTSHQGVPEYIES